MTARDEVLARIRTALGTDRPPVPEVARDYRLRDDRAAETIRDVLVDRLEDYQAQVLRCAPDRIAETVGAALDAGLGAGWRPDGVVVAPGLPVDWRPDGVVADDGRSAVERT